MESSEVIICFKRTYVQINDGVRRVWDVERIWKLAETLPVVEVELENIRGLDEVTWFSEEKLPTLRNVVGHCQRILDCDDSYPVILTEDNCVFDGMHRIAKHLLEGKKTIRAVKFEKNPPPDIGPEL